MIVDIAYLMVGLVSVVLAYLLGVDAGRADERLRRRLAEIGR